MKPTHTPPRHHKSKTPVILEASESKPKDLNAHSAINSPQALPGSPNFATRQLPLTPIPATNSPATSELIPFIITSLHHFTPISFRMRSLRKTKEGSKASPNSHFGPDRMCNGRSNFIPPRLIFRIPRISAKRMGSCIRIDLCLPFLGGRLWVYPNSTV
jgi:hypothetical protein